MLQASSHEKLELGKTHIFELVGYEETCFEFDVYEANPNLDRLKIEITIKDSNSSFIHIDYYIDYNDRFADKNGANNQVSSGFFESVVYTYSPEDKLQVKPGRYFLEVLP